VYDIEGVPVAAQAVHGDGEPVAGEALCDRASETT
jgi:hypothetical protein